MCVCVRVCLCVLVQGGSEENGRGHFHRRASSWLLITLFRWGAVSLVASSSIKTKPKTKQTKQNGELTIVWGKLLELIQLVVCHCGAVPYLTEYFISFFYLFKPRIACMMLNVYLEINRIFRFYLQAWHLTPRLCEVNTHSSNENLTGQICSIKENVLIFLMAVDINTVLFWWYLIILPQKWMFHVEWTHAAEKSLPSEVRSFSSWQY